MEKTLNEVIEEVGLSRRVIQEYEKTDFATRPTKKNKYGHLIYDEEAIERLWQIRFYRELEYSKKQMSEIFNNPNFDKVKALDEQIELLEEKKKKVEKLIYEAKMMKSFGISPITLCHVFDYDSKLNYSKVETYLTECVKEIPLDFSDERYYNNIFTEEDNKLYISILYNIAKFKNKLDFSNDTVQEFVGKLYDLYNKVFLDSIYLFCGLAIQFCPESLYYNEIEKILGKGSSEYIYNSIIYFCECAEESEIDEKIGNCIIELVNFFYDEPDASLDEINFKISQLHEILKDFSAITEKMKLIILKFFANILYYTGDICEDSSEEEKEILVRLKNSVYSYCDDYEIKCLKEK